MKSYCKENKMFVFLIIITIGTLIAAIFFQNINLTFLASIFCNIFAGMITGCILAFVSTWKARKKSKYILLIEAYKSIFDSNMKFLEMKDYEKYLSNYDILYEEIYSNLSNLMFIISRIDKYS